MPYSRGSCRPRDWTWISGLCRWILSHCTTWEAYRESQYHRIVQPPRGLGGGWVWKNCEVWASVGGLKYRLRQKCLGKAGVCLGVPSTESWAVSSGRWGLTAVGLTMGGPCACSPHPLYHRASGPPPAYLEAPADVGLFFPYMHSLKIREHFPVPWPHLEW